MPASCFRVFSLAETMDGCFCDQCAESILLRCVLEEGSRCDVAQRSTSTKQQQLVLGRIGRGGGGPPFFSVPLPARMWILFPPPPSAESDPWADVPLRRSSMGADLRVCVAVLHHATISARKLNSSLARSVLLWCSAKLSPPLLCCKRFISRVCGGLRLEFLCTGAPHQLAGL